MTAFEDRKNRTWQAPDVDVTKRKTFEKLKIYQNLTSVADKNIALLPKMQAFVNERLVAINNDAGFGTKISNGGIGDWLVADEILKMAADDKRGLHILNRQAKELLYSLVKRTERLCMLPSDKSYFEGEKICYDADKRFDDLKKLLAQLEKQEAWLRRKGFVDDAETSSIRKNRK